MLFCQNIAFPSAQNFPWKRRSEEGLFRFLRLLECWRTLIGGTDLQQKKKNAARKMEQKRTKWRKAERSGWRMRPRLFSVYLPTKKFSGTLIWSLPLRMNSRQNGRAKCRTHAKKEFVKSGRKKKKKTAQNCKRLNDHNAHLQWFPFSIFSEAWLEKTISRSLRCDGNANYTHFLELFLPR